MGSGERGGTAGARVLGCLIGILGLALVLLMACAGTRGRRVGEPPLVVVEVGQSDLRLRPVFRLDGDDGPSLTLYPDGSYLRERLHDGEVRVVQGRISKEAAATMIDEITRCVEPVEEVTSVEPEGILFHPLSMVLVLHPAEEDRRIIRVVVDVASFEGEIMIRDSAEHQAALFGDADDVDIGGGLRLMRPSSNTPEPEFWSCLRPLLRISSDDEEPWHPRTIAFILANPSIHSGRASKWPRGLPRPRRPREIRDDTEIRHSVSYKHVDAMREMLIGGERVELYGYVWTVVDLWLPWPGQRP
ncbi:MAG: hypothetical protein H6711_23675 [Myxococcales bacterium]|nr:hypothetical protein [Myxococcales bacterium]